MHASIPTMYRGIQMRSRLEARWAAYLDITDWKWEYEPVDLPGWIPDFIIYPPWDAKPILVEVKPTRCIYEFFESSDGEKIRQSLEKSAALQTDYSDFILLGVSLAHMWVLLRGEQWCTIEPFSKEHIDAWREAGNRVQWKAHR